MKLKAVMFSGTVCTTATASLREKLVPFKLCELAKPYDSALFFVLYELFSSAAN